MERLVAAPYIERTNAQGPNLDISELLFLKEQRGVAKEERITEAGRRIKKGTPQSEFESIWKVLQQDTTNSVILDAFRKSSEKLPHIKNLNIFMLAAAWILYNDMLTQELDEPTPEFLRSKTTRGGNNEDSLFITDLRGFLLKPRKNEIVRESDLKREVIEWDLIRYIYIIINLIG